jgi:hypothetical protein
LGSITGFRICGYFFDSSLAGALQRNARRDAADHVPEAGLKGASEKLQLPSHSEGFDQLFSVRMDGQGGFVEEELKAASK